MTTEIERASVRTAPAFAEFVVLIAFLMGLTALAIDSILPAFPAISADYALADPNDVQYLVYAYMIGFSVSQLFYGPLSDVVGRRPALTLGLAIFAFGVVIAIFAQSFETLIIARIIQGIGAASARVLAIAIVRDRFGGRDMARVMSFAIMVFITVPVFAPAFGSLVLFLGGWHMQFVVILLLVLAVLAWFLIRMPETLHPEYRMTFSVSRIAKGAAFCATNRMAFGYSTAQGLLMGGLMGYIGSAQQIFETDVYQLGAWFPLAFAAVAIAMGFGSWLNSKFVLRFGMRRLAHGALIGYVLISGLLYAVAMFTGGHPPLVVFGLLVAATNFLFSLSLPNFNAMSMEPLGSVAGTASSLIGFYTTLMGALLGLYIGQSFDGTVTPLGAGFFVYSVLALGIVIWTERGRLFQPQTQPAHH